MNLFFVRACLLCMFSLTVVNSQNLNYTSLTIPTELRKNANAVVRLDDMQVTILDERKMKYHYKRVVTVLNDRGNKHIRAGAAYDDTDAIKNIEAYVYDNLGKEIAHYKRKDFNDVSAVDGGTLYSDSRILYLSHTPVSYPYTVVFEYEKESPNTAFIPYWQPLNSYLVSLQKSTYQLRFDKPIAFRTNTKNFDSYNVNLQIDEEGVNASVENLQALKYEDYGLSLEKFLPELKVALNSYNLEGISGAADNWQEFGKWRYNTMIRGKDLIPEQTVQKIRELIGDITDPIEKAKIVYEYVQNNTRYISVQLGIGGWMPAPAEEVDKLGYGDCKGLTNYTKALLKLVGVDAYYSIVWAGDEKKSMEPEFASMQGNHIILNIPSNRQEVWLECTSQVMPFGFLGDFTDDRDVLVLTPEGGTLKHTPRYLNDKNLRKTEGTVTMDSNGAINAAISLLTTGIEYDNRFYIERLPEIDQLKRYKNDWDYVNNLHITDINFENIKDSIVFKEKMKVEAESYATISGDRILFAPNILDKETAIPDRYRNRLLDFEIERGYLHETDFEIVLPEGYQIEAKPDNVELESKYGRYTASIEIKDRKIHYRRSFMEKHGKHPKEEYKAFRDFKRQVARHDNAKIVLLKITK
ncbi:DUF3857 domain-containing transglutaminase family protein [Flavobacteriaceae bacterium M23B6Z8]